MKRLVIVITLFASPALSATPVRAAAAQEAGAPQVSEQGRQRLEQIKERLALTPEQVEQVRPILADEVQELKALRDSRSAGGRRDRRKMARELKRIQGKADDRLKKVLSKEQMNELKKLRDEWRQQMRDRMAQNRL